MLEKPTYEQWTAAFQEGSTYIGSWEEGSEIIFTGPSSESEGEGGTATADTQGEGSNSSEGSSGMYAMIAANRPYEFISIKHLGEIKNGEKSPWPATEEGQPEPLENYTFKDISAGNTVATELVVDVTIPSEWKEMFEGTWPAALTKLKEIAEK